MKRIVLLNTQGFTDGKRTQILSSRYYLRQVMDSFHLCCFGRINKQDYTLKARLARDKKGQSDEKATRISSWNTGSITKLEIKIYIYIWFIDQTVNMAGYWPSSFFCVFMAGPRRSRKSLVNKGFII